LPDNLWQRGNDAFRQRREGAEKVSHKKAQKAQNESRGLNPHTNAFLFLCLLGLLWLITVAGAGCEFARVFGAAARALVRGPAAWCRVWTTALVTHLGCQATRAVFVEEVT
jgi:hypothetical protein